MWFIAFALVLSILVYSVVAYRSHHRSDTASDLLASYSYQPQLHVSQQFSASTTASTTSLVVVLMAFFEIAPSYGLWLFWSVLMTAAGLWLVKSYARRIWSACKARQHSHQAASMLAIIEHAFSSTVLKKLCAATIGFGYIMAFAVELSVGSQYLAQLLAFKSHYGLLLTFTLSVLMCCMLGGYRSMVLTDRIQMLSIWGFILAIVVAFVGYLILPSHLNSHVDAVASQMPHLAFNADLIAFLIGVLVLNLPAYLPDVSSWQRIGTSNCYKTVRRGCQQAIRSTAVCWFFLVLLACLFIPFHSLQHNSLIEFMLTLKQSVFYAPLLFIATAGLLGAMLSTCTTQVMAATQICYVDLINGQNCPTTIRWTMIILICSALLLFECLSLLGFSLVDFVFSVYGCQLAIFPLVWMLVTQSKQTCRQFKYPALVSAVIGFTSCWLAAIAGVIQQSATLVFVAPAIGLILASLILACTQLFFLTYGFQNAPAKN